MLGIYTYIKNRLSSLNASRAKKFDAAIFDLEKVYQRTIDTSKASLTDSALSAWHIVKAHLFTIELYIIVLGTVILVSSTGAFYVSGLDFGYFRPFFVAVSTLVSASIALLVGFVLLPLQLLFFLRYAFIKFLVLVFTALANSAAQPFVALSLINEFDITFWDLLFPLFVVHGLVQIYLYYRMSHLVSFRKYQQRHKTQSLVSLLPTPVRGELISLASQDHYVEVTTIKGRHLMRISMKDAVAITQDCEGVQVHRSHWVMYRYMQSITNLAGKFQLQLKDGREVPISKNKVKQVQAYLDSR